MKCPYCDQEHSDNAKFCPTTGKPLAQALYCQFCGEKIEASWAACPMCGTPPGQARPPQRYQAVVQVSQPPAPPPEAPAEPDLAAAEVMAAQVSPETDRFPGETETQSTPAVQPAPVSPPAPAMYLPEPSPQPELVAEQPMPQVEKPRRHIGRWLACGCIGIPLVILLLAALFVFIDPLKLHLWSRVGGKYDAAAQVMPANTGMYLGINIGNALLTRADRVITPFLTSGQANPSSPALGYLPAAANPERAQQISIPGDLLQQIEEETGVKIPNDLTPWVGQYGGIGLVNFEDTGYGVSTPSGWIIALEARDVSKADAFLETLRGNLMDLQNMTFVSDTYHGVQVTTQETPNSMAALCFGRSGRMLLMASSPGILQDAIDSQGAGSMAGNADYAQLASLRPRDWSASVYVSRAAMGNLADMLQANPAANAAPLLNPMPYANWNGTLINATAISSGARLDMYTSYDASAQSAEEKELLQSWNTAPAQVIGVMPQDTLVFMAGSRLDLVVNNILQVALSDADTRQNFLDGFQETFGFSLQDDLLDQMNGQWALYAMPSTQGLLPSETNIDLAISLLAQIDDASAIQNAADHISSVGLSGGVTVNTTEQAGVTYYELSSIGVEYPMFAFGAGNGYALFSTDINAIQAPFAAGTLLTGTSHYRQAEGALPGRMQPSVYVDLQTLFATLREGMGTDQRDAFNQSTHVLQPVELIAAANALVREGVMRSTYVFIISSK
jgi:Protein of unknown function (DUF3352)